MLTSLLGHGFFFTNSSINCQYKTLTFLREYKAKVHRFFPIEVKYLIINHIEIDERAG